jgi:FlaA1/EpsC-like NDP-sugar epimerase
MVGTDAVCIALAMYAAISLKAGALQPVSPAVISSVLVATAISMPVFARMGLYRAVVRYMGPRAALVSAAGAAIAVLILFLLSATGLVTGLPGSTIVVFGSLMLIYVGTGRMLLRWLVWTSGTGVPRVVIYGAGGGGAELAAALSASRAFAPIAFVDDNPSLWGSIIVGRTVHAPELLPQLLRDTDSHRVLLAMPSLPSRRRREILSQLEPLGVHVQTMPGIADLVTGAARVDELQEIAVTDLLGRDPVPPVKHLFESCITGKTVLVSGAGGSIGSELCRQIIRLHPRRLVLLEISELALYNIERELSAICERELRNL